MLVQVDPEFVSELAFAQRSFAGACAKENFEKTMNNTNAVRKLFLGRMNSFIVDLLAFQ